MSDQSRVRMLVLQVLVISLLGTLSARLWYLQVAVGEEYQRAASTNTGRELITPAPRGYVLDARGVPLVQNQVALVVTVTRTALEKERVRVPDGDRRLLERVAHVIGKPFAELWGRTRMCGTPDAPEPPLCWNGSPQQPIPLTDSADPQMALQIMERREQFEGVTAELTPVRGYPKYGGLNGAHVLGYVGPVTDSEIEARRERRAPGAPEVELRRTDVIGKTGLEKQYDADLRGVPGVRRLAVDNKGAVTATISETPPVPGAHVVTSLDSRLQAVAERELHNAIRRAREVGDINKQYAKRRADSGAVVALDVRTGNVLAMASWPTYDPTIWVGGIDPADHKKITGKANNFPNLNRATQGDFVPASTFKVVTLPAAISAGYDLKKRYACPSSFSIPGRTFANYESRAYGALSVEEVVNVSCDTVFYRWAYELYLRDGARRPHRNAKDAMLNMALAFGMGRPTGIDLPAESSGRIVTRQSKQERWERTRERSCALARSGYPRLAKTDPAKAALWTQYARENCLEGAVYKGGDAINFSIGQGDTSVTPLQMARAYAAIANGGELWVPQVARGIVGPDGRVLRSFPPRSAGRLPIAKDVIAYMQRAFRTTTEKGTGAGPFRRANFPLESIPVASKTGTGEAGEQNHTTSWFASYAPADNPQIAVVMTISQGGTGSGISGPSVAEIYKAAFGVQPDRSIDPRKAIFPTRVPPRALPKVALNGNFALPGPLPAGAPLLTPAPVAPSGSPTRRPATAGRPPAGAPPRAGAPPGASAPPRVGTPRRPPVPRAVPRPSSSPRATRPANALPPEPFVPGRSTA